jgi:hypothetical protein
MLFVYFVNEPWNRFPDLARVAVGTAKQQTLTLPLIGAVIRQSTKGFMVSVLRPLARYSDNAFIGLVAIVAV